jgi:23S rRNA (uridine2552-2'-O)-methyltransferase
VSRGKGTGRRGGRRSGAPGSSPATPSAARQSPKKPPQKATKKRKLSSQRWLERHLSDPYVAEARRQGYRSRAAFKLIELDERHRLLKAGMRVVDLGAAPGGWTEVAAKRVRAGTPGGGRVLAIDILPMDPIPGAGLVVGDFLDEAVALALENDLAGPADIVLSDMAPSTTGHPGTDHLRIMALAEAAFAFARRVLAPGGAFVCKVFQGGTEAALLREIKLCFASVRHAKPPSSRPESAETYLIATHFRRRGN